MKQVVLAVAVSLALPAGNALARDAVKAAEAAKEALQLFDAGRYEQALETYRKAHDFAPLPQISFAEARCLEALGRFDDALSAAQRALTERPDRELRQRLEKKIANFRERLKVGRLVLLVNPAGADVLIDQESRGRAPLPALELTAGKHRITVRDQNLFETTQEVDIKGGGETTLEISLRPPTGRLSIRTEPPGADVLVDGALRGVTPIASLELIPGSHRIELRHPDKGPVVRTLDVRSGASESLDVTLPAGDGRKTTGGANGRQWYTNTWGWVTLGAGVGASVAGTALVFVAARDRDDVRAAVAHRTGSQSALASKWNSANTKETAGFAVLGVGGAAIVTSIILFTTNAGNRDSARGGVAPACGPNGCSLVLSETF